MGLLLEEKLRSQTCLVLMCLYRCDYLQWFYLYDCPSTPPAAPQPYHGVHLETEHHHGPRQTLWSKLAIQKVKRKYGFKAENCYRSSSSNGKWNPHLKSWWYNNAPNTRQSQQTLLYYPDYSHRKRSSVLVVIKSLSLILWNLRDKTSASYWWS